MIMLLLAECNLNCTQDDFLSITRTFTEIRDETQIEQDADRYSFVNWTGLRSAAKAKLCYIKHKIQRIHQKQRH